MRLQVLSSGSEGNALLVRAGEATLLVDAGLGMRDLVARLEAAGVGARAIDHVLLTHGHLDHARSAGSIAKRQEAWLHCPEAMIRHPSVARAPRKAALAIGKPFRLEASRGEDAVEVVAVQLPHDCDPTVAYSIEHAGRRAVVLTDMGKPDPLVARRLAGAHVLVLEFNHDLGLMARSAYPELLRKRITGERGHLSNEQAARMLELLAGPELHTLVLAHLSKRTNLPELALDAARGTLERLGLAHVRVLVASQDEHGPALEV